MNKYTPNETYSALVNRGPLTTDEMPGSGQLTHEIRQDGVTKFNPSGNAKGSAVSGTGHCTPVYYIVGKHKPKTVLQKWLDVNESRVERISGWALYTRIRTHGEGWAPAARELVDYEAPSGGRDTYERDGVCPLCGCEYDNDLPNHLPCGVNDE